MVPCMVLHVHYEEHQQPRAARHLGVLQGAACKHLHPSDGHFFDYPSVSPLLSLRAVPLRGHCPYRYQLPTCFSHQLLPALRYSFGRALTPEQVVMVMVIFLCWSDQEWRCFHVLLAHITSVAHGISNFLKPHPLFTADTENSSGFKDTRCNLTCTFPPKHCKPPWDFFYHFRGDIQEDVGLIFLYQNQQRYVSREFVP